MALFGNKRSSKQEPKAAKKRVTARNVAGVAGSAHEVLRYPWFTEKALLGTEKGVYVFAVSPSATREEVAGAVKEVYNVAPRAVRLVHLPAKKKALRGRRGVGVRAARHKAYVSLNAGDTIQFA